jgi:hypothetical protein
MGAPAVERRCRIDEVFSGGFIELLAMAPRNPIVRGLILALTRKIPPADCENFDQVKDWVEANCEKRRVASLNRRDDHEGISIAVEFSDTEYGNANYSVSRSASDQFRLDEEELVEMTQGAIDEGEGLDSLVESIATKIESCAWDRCEPSMDCGDDYEYDEHSQEDTSRGHIEFSKAHVRERLVIFLRERHPELLEELT